MNNVLVGGTSWVYYETIGGGQGGRPGPRPGMNGVHTAMTNTLDTPVEALERAFPMRVRRYALAARTAAAPAPRPAATASNASSRCSRTSPCRSSPNGASSRPWGLAGGDPGASGENWLLPGGDESRAERLPDKCTVHLDAGDVLRIRTPGGGGWGRP